MKTPTIEQFKNAKYLYRNGPQARANIYKCKTELHFHSRGVGKTQGVIADRSASNIFEMPKSTGVLVTKTFRQALSNTLPPLVRGWADLGYYEGVHFVVGIRPPAHFESPYVKPQGSGGYKYSISWINGTVIHLVSQDIIGSANGLSIDWIIVDECKLINKERFDHEIMPANRGNRQHFGHLSSHHSVMYCTDRWFGVEGNWMKELEEKVDPIRNRAIEAYAMEIISLNNKLRTQDLSDSYKDELNKKIRRYESKLNQLRRNGVYVSYASALENIHILGIDYMRQQQQLLPDLIFQVTVLNQERSLSQDPYYPHLNRNVHSYNSVNNDLLDGLNYDYSAMDSLDSDIDKDLDPHQGLYIGIDPGGNINVAVIGQFAPDGTIRVINAFYVKKPALTSDLIRKVCDYYKNHQTKLIYYYYDQTHIGRHGASELSYEGKIVETFKDEGWAVAQEYLGKVPDSDKRYQLAADYLSYSDEKQQQIAFNEINCDYLLISMESADTEEHKGIFKKNKNSERPNSGVEQEKATHFSDAFDILLWGMHHYPSPTLLSDIMKVT